MVPSGQFVLLLTEERVRVPNSALAFISMKARIKFKGLVNVSGFHVDPGYNGRLVFSVFNASPAPVHLARGDDCFLIWYASLDSSTKYLRTSAAFDGITSDLIDPIPGAVQSLAGLSDRIDKVEREQQVVRVTAGIAVTLFATLLALTITLLSRSCQSQLTPSTAPSVAAPAPAAAPVAPSPPATAAPTIPQASTPPASPRPHGR